MPTLRSASRKRLKSEADQAESKSSKAMSKNKKIKNEEITQWVMIGPDELFSADDVVFSKLPHPQNGVVSMFAFKNNKVYEMMKYKETYRSWFIDQTVQKDGSLTILTPIDPLFLVIPYFEQTSIKRNFTTLDNVMVNDEFTTSSRLLESCLSRENLENICDCKGSDDLIVYKINDDKVMEWLSQKVKKMAEYLQNSDINVKHGAQISGFVRNSDGKKNTDDCLKYAWEMVADYITEERSQRLKEKFGIKDAIKPVVSTEPPAAKKQKLNNNNESESCVEDYRDAKTSTKKSTATPKVSRTQKQLDKIDKKGMKTMSSFFTAKPKKK